MAGTPDDERLKTAGKALQRGEANELNSSQPRVKLVPMTAPDGTPAESRFGERLRYARQELGLSVEGLSRVLKGMDTQDSKGVSPPTLSRYESGETLPTLREFRLLAEALDVPSDWLLNGNLPGQPGRAQVQALTSALRDFIEFVQADTKLGELRMSESMDAYRRMSRQSLLDDERKRDQNRT